MYTQKKYNFSHPTNNMHSRNFRRKQAGLTICEPVYHLRSYRVPISALLFRRIEATAINKTLYSDNPGSSGVPEIEVLLLQT